MLAAGVDQEHDPRHPLHAANAFEVGLDLVLLALEGGLHFLRVRFNLPRLPQLFEFFKTIEAGANGAEVGQCAAEPALGDIVHAAALGFFLDGMAGLPLGADEEDVLALLHHLGDQLLGAKQTLNGFLHVDDMDHVALAVDVGFHLRVPPADAVPEMDSGVHERLH